jgi:hypothetical protein
VGLTRARRMVSWRGLPLGRSYSVADAARRHHVPLDPAGACPDSANDTVHTLLQRTKVAIGAPLLIRALELIEMSTTTP